jgi:deoxyguanosine kinase
VADRLVYEEAVLGVERASGTLAGQGCFGTCFRRPCGRGGRLWVACESAVSNIFPSAGRLRFCAKMRRKSTGIVPSVRDFPFLPSCCTISAVVGTGTNMFIAVEGCVGVGKSTVAEGLAAYRRSEALLESFENNPFLPAFYQDPVAHATETEFTFLCLHFHQLKSRSKIASAGELIADFHLGKDLLYAELNLNDSKVLNVFKQLFSLMKRGVPKPTILVCLSATTTLVIDRIRNRKRGCELDIDPNYYAKLNARYEKFFAQYRGRKLKISMDEWDFVKVPDMYRRLSRSIDKQIR